MRILIFCFVLLPLFASEARAAKPFSERDVLTAESLLDAVFERNAGIDALEAAVQAAIARIEPAGALDDPMFSYRLAPRTLGSRFRGGGFELSQRIPWPGTLAARETVAMRKAASARADLAGLRLDVIAAVRMIFAEWYYVHEALSTNQEHRQLLAELGDVAATQYAAGRASQQDALQAELELATLSKETLALERQRRTIRAGINALLNRSPGKQLPQPMLKMMPSTPASLAVLQRQAIDAHPQLAGLKAELAAERAEIELAEKNSWPDFRIFTGYNSLWDRDDKRWTVGISFNIPLNRSKYNSLVDAAQADALRARWRLIDRRADLLGELAEARAAVIEATERISLYEQRLIPLARNNFAAALADYRAGGGNFFEVIDAENRKLDIALQLIRARADYLQSHASLMRAIGEPSIMEITR